MYGSQRGSAGLIVAASLMVLIGVAALAIDGGNLYKHRSDAQNAADNSALAAAWESCQGGGDPVAAGLSVAAANGFDNNGVTDTVSITQDGQEWVAVIEVSFNGTFSKTLGAGDLGTEARASAECEPGGGGDYALFAGSDGCNNAIDWSGSTTTVTGNLRSNNDIKISGSVNVVSGEGSYRTTIDGAPDKITWNPSTNNPTIDPNILPYPVSYDIADYQQGGSLAVKATYQGVYHYAGTQKIDKNWLETNALWDDLTNTLTPGLYYTSNDIDLSMSQINATEVTFVTSGGIISFSGSSHNLSPWDEKGLLAFSDYQKQSPQSHSANCSVAGIKMSGSTQNWAGIIYAPRSLIEMSGSANTTLNGSLIGWGIQLSGSTVSIAANQNYGGGPPKVRLWE